MPDPQDAPLTGTPAVPVSPAPAGAASADRYRPETGCAAMALQRGDSMIATAPPADRWFLIEVRTAWPPQALTALQDVGPEVARRCAELGYRPALIRRPGRTAPSAVRRYALVDCRPGQESTRWGDLPSDAHLLTVLTALPSNTVPDLEPPTTEPIYLVCAHGRHDACCAVRGRPVAAALAAAYPDRTWECSHIGGDRFAGNVVVLPHALFYGQVTPARAVEVAKHHAENRVVPDLLRGSGAYPPAVQAAQHYARAAGHSLSLNTLHPTQIHQLPNHHYKITLTTEGMGEWGSSMREQADGSDESAVGPGGRSSSSTGEWLVEVEVSVHFDSVDARLTCGGKSPVQVRRFDLHSIETHRIESHRLDSGER
ncbi:sucrase ferredoxin [Kribbella antibiotica]|uniref:Sucrase ferredoxin n=1 Tax=Kribbella antibiotica TaxID=190195 RepID=A0A4V2YPD4_9ACTN|nr:sucrase ferredoxin [Kribbella antibiotica]TDD57417.1 sucrase ferredoxin [Kribbella antibiotica]